jgi:hypothetical protein
MSLIREEVLTSARRWREVIAAAIVGLAGVWLMLLGGFLLFPLGVLAAGIAAAWAVQAVRRLRFVQDVDAPGMVEVDEGQVGYLGPTFGGYVALPDLVELRVIVIHGKRLWRLKQSDGQALLIPVAAAGGERLFDAFAALPGMDTQALAVAAGDGADRVVWRRERAGLRVVGN